MKLLKKSAPKGKINPRELQRNYLDKIEGDLEEKGVIFFDETKLDIDTDYLTLPREITEVPSRDLGLYLNAFTQQKIYLRTVLGRVELLAEEAKRKYLEISTPLYAEISRGKLSETAKERMVNSDEAVRPLYETYTDRKKQINIVSYSIENIEDAVFLISREVTRRCGDFEADTRNHNVGRK